MTTKQAGINFAKLLGLLRSGGKLAIGGAKAVGKGVTGTVDAVRGMPDALRVARGNQAASNASRIVSSLRGNPEAMSAFRSARGVAKSKVDRLASLEHEFASAGRSRMPRDSYKELKALRKEMRGGESRFLNRSRDKLLQDLIVKQERAARGLRGAERLAAESRLDTLRGASAKLHRAWRGKGLTAWEYTNAALVPEELYEAYNEANEGNYGSAAKHLAFAGLLAPELRGIKGLGGLARPFERLRTVRGPVGLAARNGGALFFGDFAYNMANPAPAEGIPGDFQIPDPKDYKRISDDAHRAQGSGNWNDLTPKQRGDLIQQALDEYMQEFNSSK